MQRAQTKVDVFKYLLLCLVPFGGMYCAYKVGVLGKYILLGLACGFAVSIVTSVYDSPPLSETTDIMSVASTEWIVVTEITSLAALGFILYMLYRWFNAWNREFDSRVAPDSGV